MVCECSETNAPERLYRFLVKYSDGSTSELWCPNLQSVIWPAHIAAGLRGFPITINCPGNLVCTLSVPPKPQGTPPAVSGGQGREGKEITSDASALLFVAACAAMALIILAIFIATKH